LIQRSSGRNNTAPAVCLVLAAALSSHAAAQSGQLNLPPPPEPPAYDVAGPEFRQAALPLELGPPDNELPLGMPADAAAVCEAPDVAFTFTWLAAGGAGGFGMADFDWNRSWTWQVGEHPHPVVVTPGVGLHFWSGPQRLDLPPRVYDLYLDLSWRFLERDWWGIAGGLTPGFYGDFNRLDGRAFQLTGWLLGDWTLSERWSAVAGIAYVRQLQSNLLPVGGLIWRPNPELRIDLVIPRPRVAWLIGGDQTGETWGFVSGVFGGGAWAVAGGGQNFLVQYSDLRLAIGCERTGAATIWSAEAGLAFSRNISLDRYSVLSPDSALFLQLGIQF